MSPEIETVRPEPAQAAALVRDNLREFGAVRFRVRGQCMEPSLAEGEEVLVADAARRAPRFGDVVLFETAEGLRLHRLVFRLPRFARTKGDRAPGFDGPKARESTLGTVVGAFRASGLVPVGSRVRAVASLMRGLVARARRALPTSRRSLAG